LKTKKKPLNEGLKMAMTYSPGNPVPSALVVLTSLFEMGRGEPHRNNHHKKDDILLKLIVKAFE